MVCRLNGLENSLDVLGCYVQKQLKNNQRILKLFVERKSVTVGQMGGRLTRTLILYVCIHMEVLMKHQ